MQEKHLFEYAVIRVVPLVEREEFMNVGVILYCAKLKYLQVRYLLNKEKLGSFNNLLDIETIEHYLSALKAISAGLPGNSPIAQLPLAERFRWLTATRSTVVQTSKVHPGFCTDANAMLQQLFTQLVL